MRSALLTLAALAIPFLAPVPALAQSLITLADAVSAALHRNPRRAGDRRAP